MTATPATALSRLVFLDFDGVLNSDDYSARKLSQDPLPTPHYSQEHPWLDLDPVAVQRVERLCRDASGPGAPEDPDIQCAVVISSSWRLQMDLDELTGLLRRRGYTGVVIGVTPRSDGLGMTWGEQRGGDISRYLTAYRSIQGSGVNYVVLDDDDITGHRGHFVRTNKIVGLTDADVDAAIAILTGGTYVAP